MLWFSLLFACSGAVDGDAGDDSGGSTSDCSQDHAKVGQSVPLTAHTDGTEGVVQVSDDCSVWLLDFTFTYTDELDTRVELWLDDEPALVPSDEVVQAPIAAQDRRMALPTGATHSDWNQLVVFDPALNVLHAEASLP